MTYEERIEVLKETAMKKDILIFPEIRAVFAVYGKIEMQKKGSKSA